MWGSLDISTSGMIAQRTRLDAIAANLANRDTLVNARGEYDPFRKRIVHFAAGDPNAASPAGRRLGVHVAAIEIDENALRKRHDPDSPFADADGYVDVPDIDGVTEQVNAMAAARAYEANVVAAEAIKSTMAQALRLLA
ncbi:MAG: flagellar basal body rod protein FlgC [Phycisphaeraceae bacterium]|nr:flagellar basal body rod protein FlgC [Phycisphaeraceae bacterium]